MKIKSYQHFAGQVRAFNNFDRSLLIHRYEISQSGQYLISVNGTATTSPYGAIYIAKQIPGDPDTIPNSSLASDETRTGKAFINASTLLSLEKGEVIQIRASRYGGGGFPSFDTMISIQCVGINDR